MVRRAALAMLVPLAALSSGTECGGGEGTGGSRAVVVVNSPDSRCIGFSVVSFPPAFDFVPGIPGRVLALDYSPPSLVPIDVEPVPPRIPELPGAAEPVFELPPDSDGDGRVEAAVIPIPDSVLVIDASLALVTTSSYESVLFFRLPPQHSISDRMQAAREVVVAQDPLDPKSAFGPSPLDHNQ